MQVAVAKLLCFVKGHLLPLNRRGEGTCGPYYCGGQLTVPWGSGTHGKESSRPLCRGDSDLQRPTSLPAAAEVSQFLSYGFFSFLFFFKIQKELRDLTSTPPSASSAQQHLTVPPPKATLLAPSSRDSHGVTTPGAG